MYREQFEAMRSDARRSNMSLQMDTAFLYVCRYPFAPCNRARQPWRLIWAKPGAESYTCAEGECSARYFETMGDAIAYGKHNYGETATRWVWGEEFPQPKGEN